MLTPWMPGELFANDGRWDAEELLGEILARVPDGVAPEPLPSLLEKVGGSYVPRT
jgi:hypothetical protein